MSATGMRTAARLASAALLAAAGACWTAAVVWRRELARCGLDLS